jgi:glycosyltransferase involved in cell wall biosynthesis
LQSLLVNQTLQNIEIICINDGSTDGTGERLDEWQIQYPDKIKVIHQKNSGPSAARNSGMKIAQGEYIGFVDSDDFVNLNMYAELYQLLSNNDVDVVSCNYQTFINKDTVINSNIKQTTNKKVDPIEELLNSPPKIFCNLYKSKFLQAYRIKFVERFRVAEDFIFAYEVAINSNYKLLTTSAKLYYYRKKRIGQLTAITNNNLYYVFNLFDYLENIKVADNKKILATNFILKRTITILISSLIKIDSKYKKDFCVKVANYTFKKYNAWYIYKKILTYKYKNILSYLVVPVFTIMLHCCYLLQKYNIIKATKQSYKK